MASGNVILNEIEAPLIAKKAKPGQFVILKAGERGSGYLSPWLRRTPSGGP